MIDPAPPPPSPSPPAAQPAPPPSPPVAQPAAALCTGAPSVGDPPVALRSIARVSAGAADPAAALDAVRRTFPWLPDGEARAALARIAAAPEEVDAPPPWRVSLWLGLLLATGAHVAALGALLVGATALGLLLDGFHGGRAERQALVSAGLACALFGSGLLALRGWARLWCLLVLAFVCVFLGGTSGTVTPGAGWRLPTMWDGDAGLVALSALCLIVLVALTRPACGALCKPAGSAAADGLALSAARAAAWWAGLVHVWLLLAAPACGRLLLQTGAALPAPTERVLALAAALCAYAAPLVPVLVVAGLAAILRLPLRHEGTALLAAHVAGVGAFGSVAGWLAWATVDVLLRM